MELYDTTLRDGAQAEGISFSLEDKILIAEKLDALGIHFIEGGQPADVNLKDNLFFDEMKKRPFKKARLVSFGSTRRVGAKPGSDPNLNSLLQTETQTVTIVGKASEMHVNVALKTTLDENLRMIHDSVKYLKDSGRQVFFDAEHFFDGYKENQQYALKVLKEVENAGGDMIVLCDTNGGMLETELKKITDEVVKQAKIPLGIHTHNDSELAVANTISAVTAGCVQVQGTINGYGERCGNANLCSIIPILQLKMGMKCLDDEKLKMLKHVSIFVSQIANMPYNDRQPFVGVDAFAHKGGIHVSAVRKDPKTYEHIDPEDVGNKRRVLISELSGKSNVIYKAKELGIPLVEDGPVVGKIVEAVKKLESEGYQFDGAEGSFEILIRKHAGKHKRFFKLEGFRVIIEKDENGKTNSEATIKLKVDGIEEHTAAEGDGPVNAIDNALRKALEKFYPVLKDVNLTDYKVRVIDQKAGTGSKVRVLIESGDKKNIWGTIGVSPNLIEASWQALVDSIEVKLLREEEKK